MKTVANQLTDSIKLPGQSLPVCSKAIIRLQGYGNYTWVYLAAQTKPILVALTLKWFEDQLPSFIRVHKSEMINPTFVRAMGIDGDQQLAVCLLNEYKAKVSRRRFEQVLIKINQHKKVSLIKS
ncbi:LytTR family transcriptional regulator [Spirosoma sp. HMF3257]|uniref:LytTR family transcriptional regulator n=1 Tax=Spirosoma telluris TaxID=2183553 RepID=A0A327NNM6_9BACT|nr:LytTR family transcriptional regulator [Spirosoma telluris]RAI76822.1 LytTR family transcriptional regulator [Spirosoma telluris]